MLACSAGLHGMHAWPVDVRSTLHRSVCLLASVSGSCISDHNQRESVSRVVGYHLLDLVVRLHLRFFRICVVDNLLTSGLARWGIHF